MASGERVTLSSAGERRRSEILGRLEAQSRHRRVGVRVLRGVGGAALLALVGVAFAVAMVQGRAAPDRREIVHQGSARDVLVHTGQERRQQMGPAHTEHLLDAHIMVVRNEPLPTRTCGSGAAAAGDTGVCLLDDAGLLRELDRAGGSYGIVRVNGKVEVVSNRDGEVLDGGD